MKDNVFGELIFNNGWEKVISCDFWNTGSIKIRVSAYEDEMPNEEQKDAYNRFIEDMEQISRMSRKKMKEYMAVIADDILAYCGIDTIPDDICQLVSINHILFMESGNFAIMCDVNWDSHGAAILCMETEIIAGPQDIVWMYE